MSQSRLSRRTFLAGAAAIGASAAWASPRATRSKKKWVESRETFAEGVASGDPDPSSVILWTRVTPARPAAAVWLTVEVAEDPQFRRVVASSRARAVEAADHTCRVLVGGLKPAHEYWYRFSDDEGKGSRVGRTLTAPAPDDPRPVSFAFVSCQNPCEGALHAYRRMIFEDERAAPADRLAFVLHLGDFIYEVVDYPEDLPGGMRYDRKLRDLIRFPKGEKIQGLHIPVTVEDYRTVYRAYLHDPDLQDARAHFPFVNMWDNHEFSWLGWQSFQRFEGKNRPMQTRKVAANRAWFEYEPARVTQAPGASLESFKAPDVVDAPIERFDADQLGLEPNNLAAIRSLTGYRSLTFGKHVELLITDQHSYRSQDPGFRPEASDDLESADFPNLIPEETMRALDFGRAYPGGAPDELPSFAKPVKNFRKSESPQTILGAEQKAWFLARLKASRATWKIWGNSEGTLDHRADPQNLPEGGKKWMGASYASLGGGDYGTAYHERGEIYDLVKEAKLTGFLTVSGDLHSFWAGLSAKSLPPLPFEPVGAAFVTGSISAPGLVEAFEHRFPKDHPLRPLYLADRPNGVEPTVNMLSLHGVKSCLEYQKSGDLAAARRLSNPGLAPHLKFLDMGGHGYATVRVSAEAAECEFVCIPRPLERSAREDGGPLRYRVRHRIPMWAAGERPRLEQKVVEGDPGLSV
jgi:alkaline phosphatase D